MTKKSNETTCCMPGSAFKVEAVVSIDERGQMLLPKELRAKADIHTGDKLAVVSFDQGGKTCCLALINADKLTGMVKELLGPMMKGIEIKDKEDE